MCLSSTKTERVSLNEFTSEKMGIDMAEEGEGQNFWIKSDVRQCWLESGLKAARIIHISKSESVYWKCHLNESDLGPCIGWQCIYKFTPDSHSKVSRINIMRHLHGRALEIMHHANDVARWMRWFQFSPHPSSPSHPRG